MMHKIEDMAKRQAGAAKPGILKVGGKTYTFVFDHTQWVYNVYEDMEFLHGYNTKSLTKAKKWLRDYLAN